MTETQRGRVALLTLFAMLAFAGNSLLCRLALGQGLIDAASFTSVRVIAGAATLAILILPRWREQGRIAGDWWASAMLFVYMIGFSFAYLSLSAGAGALILFGAVQLTMIAAAWRAGERFTARGWIGLAVAMAGLTWLMAPGATAPDGVGALLMTTAGVAWGFYSLRGRGQGHPLERTAMNFLYAVPFAVLVSAAFMPVQNMTFAGIALAVTSGAVTSGLGYAIWYAALPGLSATVASIVQLTVPVIAAFGGVALLSEDITLRLLTASAAVLGGVAMVVTQRHSASGSRF